MSPTADQFLHVRFRGVAGSPIDRPLPAHDRAAAAPFPRPAIPLTGAPSQADRNLITKVFSRHKLNGSAYRARALHRRIPACLRALQSRCAAEARRRVEADPAAANLALDALLNGATAFYRDLPVFNHLLAVALPQMLRTAPTPRILSVGCSDGAELYSLAMCLRELGVTAGDLRGIDCRRSAIDRARAGVYPDSALINLSPAIYARYFDRTPSGHKIKRRLHTGLQWQVANAFDPLPTPLCDLIACRNVAIYLERPAAQQLWPRIEEALRPGGLLLIGKAEFPGGRFIRVGPCLYRKAAP